LDTALRLFGAGGIVMIPLLICSIFALAVVIEKLYALRARKVIAPAVVELAGSLRTNEDMTALAGVCRRIDTPFARVIRTGLENADLPRAENVELIQSAARHEVGSLERGLTILEIITGISPLLGLLGTVLGMFHVFSVIVESGVGEASALSGGISEALLTTIVGLFIAIPSLVAHSYFSKRVDDLTLEIERHASSLVRKLYSGRPQARATWVEKEEIAG